jgi:hypothetical protein
MNEQQKNLPNQLTKTFQDRRKDKDPELKVKSFKQALQKLTKYMFLLTTK